MSKGVSPLRVLLCNKRTIYSLFIIPLLAIVLLAGTLTLYHYNFARAASADTLVSFPGMVPPAVAHSKLVGQANPQQTISLSIGLRLRNAGALKSYVADIARPKSANYHRYLTAAQIQGAFSPSIATHNAVLQYLRSSGFTITHTYNHRMLVTFSGTVGLAEQVFHVTINNYTAPGGQAFYSNSADPEVPASLAGLIQSISGLNNFQRWHHASVQTHALTSHASITPSVTCLGHSSNNSYYTPDQIQTAYNLNGLYGKGFHGEGQTVALFELDTFQSGDLSAYESCFGHSHTTIQTIKAGSGTVPSDSGIVEAELDAELVLSTAPSLGTLVMYEAANDTADYNAEWARIVQDAPPVVSTSWGSCESDAGQQEANQENSFYAIAAAQGQSIFAASGDSGSSGCYFDQGSLTPKALEAGDPAAQPLVTGVGGTTLTINSNSTYNKEITWNNPSGASGGGISQFWSKPSWQNAPGVGTGNRESPDVSLNADPNKGYLIYCTATAAQCPNSGWIIVGGTSASSPMWAAMMALVNEELVRAGSFNIGFLNPLLYQVANGGNYGTDFHDVTTGNNDYNNLQGGKYAAGPVYDMATGLGSFNADALATDLVTLAKANNGQRLSPVAKTWYFPEGSEGGGFLEYVTLQNPDPTLTATVTFSYLSSNAAPVVVTHSVAPSSRQTFDAQADLKTTPSGTGYHDGVIIQVTSGPGIVAERPIYFIWSGYNSGIDVVGATHTSTTYYFSEADTTQAGSANYKTYVAMINPSQTLPAKATLTYYTGSCTTTCPTEQVTINPMSRQSVSPTDKGIHGKVAIAVTSDNPIVAERPMYFSNYIARAGGQTTGAASVIGATSPGNDWLFAEGYTGGGFQEYLELANFGTVAANVNIKLEYTDASTQNFTVPVAAGGNVQFDVNAVQNGHPNSLSAEVTSNNPIVAQRLMYFHFGPSHISGGTDIVGETGPASHNVYSFAEGYTGGSFNEFLSVQNPTGNQETISVTLFTKSVVFQLQAVVAAHSRKTFSINGILNPINGGSVSMTVQAIGSNTFIVSERPMYFIYSISGISGTINGGTDVLGYTGA
jgi:Pro-kumamolisin, activation domain